MSFVRLLCEALQTFLIIQFHTNQANGYFTFYYWLYKVGFLDSILIKNSTKNYYLHPTNRSII